jgi:hypothetical protein
VFQSEPFVPVSQAGRWETTKTPAALGRRGNAEQDYLINTIIAMKIDRFYGEAAILVRNVEQYITYTAKSHLRVQAETIPGEIFPEERYSIMLEDSTDGYILILNKKTAKEALKKFKKELHTKAEKL